MNNQATKYEWIVNKETEWNSHSSILLHYLPFAGLLMNLQSRCVWRDAVKAMDTVYLPPQTAVGSRKQNHYVQAVLKSNKLLLIQCNMVPVSVSEHLVCNQYCLWSLKNCVHVFVCTLLSLTRNFASHVPRQSGSQFQEEGLASFSCLYHGFVLSLLL